MTIVFVLIRLAAYRRSCWPSCFDCLAAPDPSLDSEPFPVARGNVLGGVRQLMPSLVGCHPFYLLVPFANNDRWLFLM